MRWHIEKIENKSYIYTHPDVKGINHFYKKGLFTENLACYDIRSYQFIEFTLTIKEDMMIEVDLYFMADNSPQQEKEYHAKRKLAVSGSGNQHISLELSQFDDPGALGNNYKYFRGFKISSDKEFTIKEVQFKKGKSISLTCNILSKAVKANEVAEYDLTISNCENQAKRATLFQKREGWETLPVEFLEYISLAPWEEKVVKIQVRMTEEIVPGGYERQTIVVIPEGLGSHAKSIEFITARYLPHPTVLVNEKEIKEVKNKIALGGWAKETKKLWKQFADEWKTPVMNREKSYLFETGESNQAKGCAILYSITGDAEYARKVADMLKELANPHSGYLHLPHAGSQELVHEGEFFKQMATAYDLIYNSGFFEVEDRERIEAVFRLFMELMEECLTRGEISNWTLAEAVGAVYCAAVLQDRERMHRFLFGKGGITEHISKGILDDGFWFECTIGYHLLSAGLLSEAAQAVKHFGINLADMWVSASYSKKIGFPKFERDGLILEAWGPKTKSYRNIAMLWDSLLPFFDYRGIIPGMNDSCEMKLPGIAKALYDHRYDLAYYLYGKSEYAQAVKELPPIERDLLFGCFKAPAIQAEELYKKSVYADNGGLAVLRSKTEERPQSEQIQVALKYGSHGGAHGHYDRVSITGISRYGKSLYSPENVWYSYHTFMYKFYVQNSITHNMVTVDLKQQDPACPDRRLFYSGNMLQACELVNSGKWCNPPYGGWTVDVDNFKERTWREGKYVPIPENVPSYMERTDFTEEILQKRLTLVTDDYIVNVDLAKGMTRHQYDCIYHFKALKEVKGERLKYIEHQEQLDTNPLGSGQFITDCDRYEAEGITKMHFESYYDEEQNNGGKWLTSNRTAHNTHGIIKTDLYAVWPTSYDIIIGHPPEYDRMYKQLWYEVWLDDTLKAQGNFGAWVLGREDIWLDVSASKQLTLITKVKDVEFEPNVMQYSKNNIFWGNPYFTGKDGTKTYLCDLPLTFENIVQTAGEGVDYEGGPIKIQGELFDKSVPAEPENTMMEARITISLEGLTVDSFASCVGADYPIGSEEDIRKSIFFRTAGREARFTTIVELYENEPAIKQIEEDGANKLVVHLMDGRTQIITICNFEQEEQDTQVMIEEYKLGQLIRSESTVNL